MAVGAVLFDVGGPLDTEVMHEQLVDRDIVAAFAAAGVSISADELAAASEAAVTSFAPDAYAAMVWTLSNGDIELTVRVLGVFRGPGAGARRAAERGGLELRPGIAELLMELYGDGLKLGLAANQPARIVLELDRFGIGHLFSHREVSEHHGFRKPDVRLFLRACDDLQVEPSVCIMVGDRVDNDVAPARLLGMATVLLRTGRHIAQQPRSIEEVPDAEVTTVAELREAIAALRAR